MQFVEQDFDIEEFLSRPLFAHIATLGDCGPCETPVWFLWEEGALWIIASSAGTLPKRLGKDERTAIGIVDFDLEQGFLQHLGFRGVATVVPMDQDRRTRLVRRYLGHEDQWSIWFKESVVDRQDVLVKFVPDSAVARDQSYFRLGNASNKAKRREPQAWIIRPFQPGDEGALVRVFRRAVSETASSQLLQSIGNRRLGPGYRAVRRAVRCEVTCRTGMPSLLPAAP
jgi:nitroimidazol reductase NimA-like FMN-containing flavoprotein (pyridoxamine 5'-phosphate oxidase superfamily)